MAEYRIIWDALAAEDLNALPKNIAQRIHRKVTQHLSQAPRELGKPLTGKLKNHYRYRIGDYRVIYEVIDQEICIVIVRLGNRKDIYDKA